MTGPARFDEVIRTKGHPAHRQEAPLNVNVLDALPPYLRHLVFALVSALLAWAGTDLVPVLKDQPGWGAVAASLLTVVIAAVLPLTRQYGVGARTDQGGE